MLLKLHWLQEQPIPASYPDDALFGEDDSSGRTVHTFTLTEVNTELGGGAEAKKNNIFTMHSCWSGRLRI